MRKLLSLALLLSLAQAQTGVGVSPPRVLLPLAPGASATQTVVVDHPGRQGTLRVSVVLSTWTREATPVAWRAGFP